MHERITPTPTYRAIVDQLPVGIVIYDRDLRVVECNESCEELIGVARDEIIGLGIDDLRDQCLAQLAVMVSRRSPRVAGEFRIVCRDQAVRWIAMRIDATFADDGQFLGAWALIQDVSERRHLEEQLCQAQKMEAMGQLAAGVAHDFNNLLTVMKLDGELLEQALDECHLMRETVSDIRTVVDRAAGLTKQLLAFSRPQLLRPRLLDLNEVILGAMRMLARLIGEDIELVTNLRPSLPRVLADPDQLVQVLVNLAVNARDAMPRGGRLDISTGVRLIHDTERETLRPPGTYVVVDVSDTGQGMDEATRRRIFEPFFTTKPAGRGTGLGLSTVHGIMERLAGHVTVATEPGRGATFTLHFLPQAADEIVGALSRCETSGHRWQPGTATVLLVEDEPAVRAVCRRILEREGHTVLVAEDGNDALRVASSFSGRIDLVLTDLVLPAMSGPEIASRLMADRSGLRVLYMSGYTSEEIQRRGLGEQNSVVLEKPFAATELLAAVCDALSGWASAEAEQ